MINFYGKSWLTSKRETIVCIDFNLIVFHA